LADHLFAGRAGHVLYLKSELTEGRWRIYSDNIAMARWLQTTVQGMLNAELSDTTIPCADATFAKAGDVRTFWTESIKSHGEDIGTRLVRNDIEANGQSWKREREGRPFFDVGAGVLGKLDGRALRRHGKV